MLGERCAEIRARIGIEQILGERGYFPARSTPGSPVYRCPLPGHEDQHPSFVVRGERWRCWSQCARGGDVIDLVAALDGIETRQAIEALAERCGLGREAEASAPAGLSPERAARLLRGFLAGRGWDPGAAAEAGLHVVIDERGRPRVRFLYNYGNEPVWHQDRLLGEGRPKWLSPKGRRPALFNANALRLAAERSRELLVVEGPSDCLAILSTFAAPAVVGVPGASNFSPSWVPAFRGLQRLFVIGDNDAAGEKLRARVRELLAPVVGAVVDVYVPAPHKDVDEWRRACGTERPELFGEALIEALDGAGEVAA